MNCATCDWIVILWCPLEDNSDTPENYLAYKISNIYTPTGAVNLYQYKHVSQKSLTGTTVKKKKQKTKHFQEFLKEFSENLRIVHRWLICSTRSSLFQ